MYKHHFGMLDCHNGGFMAWRLRHLEEKLQKKNRSLRKEKLLLLTVRDFFLNNKRHYVRK
jgi:hypothetical protein